MRTKLFLLTGVLLLILALDLSAQQKLEREYRVKERHVPPPALAFIHECFGDASVKWYGEESLIGKTFEAKVKIRQQAYSAEFDTLGNIQDVELLMGFGNIPKETRDAIRRQLSNRFTNYKIKRCQLQWLGDAKPLQELITKGETMLDHKIRYELVLRGKSGKENEFYEFLFDDKGNTLRSSVIIQPNTNNLFY